MISYILIALVDAKVKHFIDIAKKTNFFWCYILDFSCKHLLIK